MDLDKKFETMLKKRVELEKLRLEGETLRTWKERIEKVLKIHNDYRSLEIELKKLLQSMDNRLRLLQSQMREIG